MSGPDAGHGIAAPGLARHCEGMLGLVLTSSLAVVLAVGHAGADGGCNGAGVRSRRSRGRGSVPNSEH
eukprot:1145417-Rhodomonas_salina.1